MTPGRCHRCKRSVLQTWRVESMHEWLCARCIREALEVTRSYSLDETLRRLRGRE